MRAITTFTIIALFSSLGSGRADFAMLPPEPTTGEPPPATESPAAVEPQSAKPVEKQPAAHTAKMIEARGFGKKIPLSFAVRQIVPTPVKVTFGRGANTSALVDWQGGREWPAVLREAVRPLGLHVTVRENAVSISR